MTLSLAIQLYADLGVNRFDFLAGGETYKSILADHNYVLLWGTARKRKAKFLLIDALRGAKQSLVSFVEGSSSRV